jgi:hypothetical protein
MAKAPVQPKPTEVPRTNHPCGHLCRYKSSKETSSSSKSNYKTIDEEEASEDEAINEEELFRVQEDEAIDEEELFRVQQEIERLY